MDSLFDVIPEKFQVIFLISSIYLSLLIDTDFCEDRCENDRGKGNQG